MKQAVDSGVNFFDTAPMYGDGASELLLGKFVKEHNLRHQTIIATKIRPSKMKPDDVVKECEDSLQRLQTDFIDLYQTHWTSRDVSLDETWGAMLRLKEQGKIRFIGVSNMGIADLTQVLRLHKPLTNQLPYNLLWRMIEAEILPKCIQDDVGVLVYSPLMHGILAGNYKTAAEVPDGRARTRHFSSARPSTRHGEPGCETETFEALSRIREIADHSERSMGEIALAWTMQQPGIVSLIAGARNADQVRDNVNFLSNPLPNGVLEQLSIATQELKEVLGPNPDMWDSSTNSRYR